MDKPLQHIDDVLHHCIHCGMCLPVCPTYALTNQEQSSPRGRIRLMRSLYEGSLELSDTFVDEMYFCLDCQACQTACPADVQYGTLVEDARKIIAEQRREPFALRFIKKILLRGILSSNSRTRLVASLLRAYRKSGLQNAVDESQILSAFSEKLQAKHALLPAIAEKNFDEESGEIVHATSSGRGTVALLTGCIMNVAFPEIHRDVVEVLTTNGFTVRIPKEQVCCGSLHAHYGDREEAKRLARRNIDIFDAYEFDALIVDSAGCGAFLKEYVHVLEGDPDYAPRAQALSARVKEITEFLAVAGYKIPGVREELRVTYHEACHLVHTQKISRQPRELMSASPGVEIVELPEATWCCGSAGIYNVVRFEDSMKLLERKIGNLASTNADVVLTANPGCHVQLQYGIKKYGLTMNVMHPVSLLARSYRLEKGSATP